MKSTYFLRPKAQEDLLDQAYYLEREASQGVGHSFLISAHETFALLATYPNMGWHPRLRSPALTSLRVFAISGFRKMLVLYIPSESGVEIVRVVHGSRDLAELVQRLSQPTLP